MVKRNPRKDKPNIVKRFYTYKYSGLITVPIVLAVIIGSWYGVMLQMEFYDNFTCDGLIIYKINNVALNGNPTYNELDEHSKERYDTILNECAFDGVWFYHKTPIINAEHVQILRNEIVITGSPEIPLQAVSRDFNR